MKGNHQDRSQIPPLANKASKDQLKALNQISDEPRSLTAPHFRGNQRCRSDRVELP